jgi:hypothetical protein
VTTHQLNALCLNNVLDQLEYLIGSLANLDKDKDLRA